MTDQDTTNLEQARRELEALRQQVHEMPDKTPWWVRRRIGP